MSPKQERRSGRDRRVLDLGAPVGKELRKKVEARKPEIVELELSETEWEEHFGGVGKAMKAAELQTSIEASEVLGRVRE